MEPIDKAIEAMKLYGLGEQLTFKKCADIFEVNRITLAQRCKGVQGSVAAKNINQRKLSPQQEAELTDYIKDFKSRGLPTTRAMMRHFAAEITKQPVGKEWVGRFLKRNKDHLTSKWAAGMDAVRHHADSEHNYNLNFDLFHEKMKQYNVEPRHTYNMDEKGLC
ncbi:hypothetical protein EK21DRAFT_74914 [Setomelanomma holmii]|uniref:HTH CENPB-type domain-containing protein n=1 Tax=Setomelanomma holmii TaxID=210430 RepID=A0A9P4LGV5_9PLEO|nr:hypothetical protein EK21DRAFT_74914 [Setomelanomma holmii]